MFEGRPLTTRGRWFNSVVMPFLRGIARIPPPVEATAPIYIVGSGRSGTTILGVVLSMHEDVGFLNEPKALWHVAVENDDLVGNYTTAPGRYKLDAADASSEVKTTVRRIYSWYQLLTMTSKTVDKYPEMVFRMDFIHELFADAKVLFLVRNGNDTCISAMNWSESHSRSTNLGDETWWGLNDRKWHYIAEQLVPHDPELADAANSIAGFTRDADRSAVEWILSMRAGIEATEKWPDSVMQVSYEDLTIRPRETLEQISTFTELKPDSRMLDYAQNTLHKGRQNTDCELDPLIRPAFRKMMRQLGYSD